LIHESQAVAKVEQVRAESITSSDGRPRSFIFQPELQYIRRSMDVSELTGTIVPLVTPFDAEDRLDRAALGHLVEFVLQQGADRVMATALTGEGPLLDLSETLSTWTAVFEAVHGRVGVIPAAITSTTRAGVKLAKEAERMGSEALMVAPIVPELYAGRSRRDVFEFHADIASVTALPLVLFNYPSLTGVDLTPDFVAELSEIPTVRYIKESTGDSRRVHQIHRLTGDRVRVICGNPNAALESLALGCKAWLTGIMNAVPRSAGQMMDAIHSRNDLLLARRIYYRQILPLVDIMGRNNNPTGTIKAALRARGISVGVPRKPGSDVSLDDYEILESLMKSVRAAEEAYPGSPVS